MPNGQPRRSLDPSRARELFGFTRPGAAARGNRAHGRLVPVADASRLARRAGLGRLPRGRLWAWWRSRSTILAIALPIEHQELGCAETSSYALVRALANGTPWIDENERETCDKARRGDHFYSSKAPGLALVMLPAYEALHATGLLPDEPPHDVVAARALVGDPAGRRDAAARAAAGESVRAGHRHARRGRARRSATMTLPLAALNFGHILAATLLLGVVRDRRRAAATGGKAPGAPRRAGALAGLAVTTEYPAGTRRRRDRRLRRVRRRAPIQPARSRSVRAASPASPRSCSTTTGRSARCCRCRTRPPSSSETAEGVVTVGPARPRASTASSSRASRPRRGSSSPTVDSSALTPVMLVGAGGHRPARPAWLQGGGAARSAAITASGCCSTTRRCTINAGWVFGGDSPGPRYFYLAMPFAILPLGLV